MFSLCAQSTFSLQHDPNQTDDRVSLSVPLPLSYPLTSHSPFAKDYLSYQFGIMDHAVLEWQMIQHWRYEVVGMSKLLQLFFHKNVIRGLYSVGHRIMLVTRTLESVIVTHEFDWEVDKNMEHKWPIYQTSPIIYNFLWHFPMNFSKGNNCVII